MEAMHRGVRGDHAMSAHPKTPLDAPLQVRYELRSRREMIDVVGRQTAKMYDSMKITDTRATNGQNGA